MTTTFHGHLHSGRTNPSPIITVYRPQHNPEGIGLIILPGGGYNMLAAHEGAEYARHFQRAGLCCFVVEYRLGSAAYRHPAMLEDALSAVAVIRERADAFAIKPERIGIMGSSAGGHLGAHTLTSWHQYSAGVSLRPDFGILCYPVILSSGPCAHRGSFTNLAGHEASPLDLAALSCDRLVRNDTPPCFIWHGANDPSVPMENSLAFTSALRQHGVSFELHIYRSDGHGHGLKTPFDWHADALRWVRAIIQ